MQTRSLWVNPIPGRLSRAVTTLWWLCTIIAAGWASLVAIAIFHDLARHDTAGLWQMAAAGVLPLFILIGPHWIRTGRWRFGPPGA